MEDNKVAKKIGLIVKIVLYAALFIFIGAL